MKFVLRRLVIAAVFALAPGLTSAATVSLQYNGGTAGGHATIKASPVTPAGGLGTYGAWGFKMTDLTQTIGDASGNFIAWCLDLSHYLGRGTSPYKTTTTPFSNSYGLGPDEMLRVQKVFDANYATLVNSNDTQAAGFQVALWEALYDTGWNAGQGDFRVKSGAVRAQANAFLAAASVFSAPKAYDLTFLESTGTGRDIRQNLVTALPVSPVPIPAAGWLLMAGLGGLGALRYKRKVA